MRGVFIFADRFIVIIIDIIQKTKVSAVAEKQIIRADTGKITDQIRFIFINVTMRMCQLMAHGKWFVGNIHDIIIICFHGKRKIISLHVLLTHEIRKNKCFWCYIESGKSGINGTKLLHTANGSLLHVSVIYKITV